MLLQGPSMLLSHAQKSFQSCGKRNNTEKYQGRPQGIKRAIIKQALSFCSFPATQGLCGLTPESVLCYGGSLLETP